MTKPYLRLDDQNDQRRKKSLNLHSTTDSDKHPRLRSTEVPQSPFYKVHVRVIKHCHGFYARY